MPFPQKKRLERWLRQQLYGGHKKELSSFIVFHQPMGGRKTKIQERSMADAVTVDELEAFVDEIMSIMENDAEGCGYQRYVVESYRVDDEEPDSRLPVNVHGSQANDEGDSLDHEGPSAKGIVAQAMRHNESHYKTTLGAFQFMMQSLQRQLELSMQQTERLMEKSYKDMETREKAESLQHERELQAMVASAEMDRKDKLVEKVTNLLPAVVNRLGGKKLLPEPKTPQGEMLKGLVHSLRPEQFNGIAANLDQDQMILLMQLIQTYQAEEEAKGNGDQSKGRNGA